MSDPTDADRAAAREIAELLNWPNVPEKQRGEDIVALVLARHRDEHRKCSVEIDGDYECDWHSQFNQASERIAELERKLEANSRILSGELEAARNQLAEAQRENERLRELVEALDVMLVLYRTGDMRNGAAKVDRLIKARAALDPKGDEHGD